MKSIKLLKQLFSFTIFLTIIFTSITSVKAQTCTSKTPGKPDIFQIDTTDTTATLHVTPPADDVTAYSVIYGFSEGDEKFSANFPSAKSTGALTFTIENLTPQTTYFFKIQAINSCAYGEWSSWKSATVASSSTATTPVSTTTVTPSTLPEAGRTDGLVLLLSISLFIIFFSFLTPKKIFHSLKRR